MGSTDIKRNLPNDEFNAATNSASPSASNPFATTDDLASATSQVKVDVTDSTAGFLEDKLGLPAQAGIFITEVDLGGGNKQLQFEIGPHFKLLLVTGLITGGELSIHTRVIASIQGDGGVPNTVSVTTSIDHDLSTSDVIDITGTTNYNEVDVTVTVTGATTYTYQTSAHTESGLENAGNAEDDTKMDVASGEVLILDVTDPQNPDVTVVVFVAQTVTGAFMSPEQEIFFLINSSATIIQQSAPASVSERRSLVALGNANVSGTFDSFDFTTRDVLPGLGLHKTFEDFITTVGGIKVEGNEFSGVTGTLQIKKAAGIAIGLGRNFDSDTNRPNTIDLLAIDPIPLIFKIHENAIGDIVVGAVDNFLDPDQFNSVGTLVAMPTGHFQVLRIFHFPLSDATLIYYGERTYLSIGLAKQGITTEGFKEHPITKRAMHVADIIIQEGVANTDDVATALYVERSEIRNNLPVSKQVGLSIEAQRTLVSTQSTGLIEGGSITATPAGTVVTVASGSGDMVDGADPANPFPKDIVWTEFTNVTIPDIVTENGHFILISPASTLVFIPFSTGVTSTDKRDNIFLGLVRHEGTTVQSKQDTPISILNPINMIEDLTSALGMFTESGNIVSSNGANLLLDKELGDTFLFGGNFRTNPQDPSHIATPLSTGFSMVRLDQNGETGATSTSIDPENFDDAGTPTVVGNNQWTMSRVWYDPINDDYYWQFGSRTYTTAQKDNGEYFTEQPINPPGFTFFAYVIARIVIQKGQTDLSNAIVLQGSGGLASGGSGSTATRQSVYNNSLPNPETLTNDTNGPDTWRRGTTGGDDDIVTEVQNNAGVRVQSVTGNGDITSTGKCRINTILVDLVTHSLSIIPTGTLGDSEVWHGIHIDGGSTDPTASGAEISGIEIDLSGVDTTNDPVMHGIEIDMPVRKDAMHIHEGQVVVNNTPDNTVTSEFHAHDVRVDLTDLDTTSAWSAMAITAVGSTAGSVDALLVRNLVGVARQEVGTFASPSQTEFAGRKTSAGTVWVDGLDGTEIFIVDNDEIYIGSSVQFSQIEVIMSIGANKDCTPTFFYNTAADTWTEFFPDDETSGFQTSSLISWVPDSISALWTGDGDPGAGDTTAGFWIKIIRTRNADPGTPTITTMKTGTVVTHQWDKEGVISIKTLNETNPNWQPLSVNLGDGFTTGVTRALNDDNAGVIYPFLGSADGIISFNWDLEHNGVPYDGSDLAIELLGRVSVNGTGGDTVGWVVDYKFRAAGDNLATGATSIAQQNVDVSSELQNIGFSTTLGTMSGVVGKTTLLVTLTRNSDGVDADAFAGDWEGMGIKLIKV